tara:strand:+ start:293 stop:424 length:132 start_codon:yes stop_codon:yes gene_type:complete
LKGAGLSLAISFMESGASKAFTVVEPSCHKGILAIGNLLISRE